MCAPAAVGYGLAALGVGATAYSAVKMSEMQTEANKQAAEQSAQAEKMAKQQEDQLNSTAQRTKRFDPASMLYGPKKGDVGSTSLTGPMGVDMGALSLGRNSLLGS